jgi:hypothetical protein
LEDEGLSEKATISNLIRRVNAMKILIFLVKDMDKEEAYYLQQIADRLDMTEATAFNNLDILIQAGVLGKAESKCNRKNKYFAIINKELAEKIVCKYKHRVAFCLGRLVPHRRVYASQFKRDKRFIDACSVYGLDVSEAFCALLDCYKIGREDVGTDIIIWRNMQGYDSESDNESAEPIEIE